MKIFSVLASGFALLCPLLAQQRQPKRTLSVSCNQNSSGALDCEVDVNADPKPTTVKISAATFVEPVDLNDLLSLVRRGTRFEQPCESPSSLTIEAGSEVADFSVRCTLKPQKDEERQIAAVTATLGTLTKAAKVALDRPQLDGSSPAAMVGVDFSMFDAAHDASTRLSFAAEVGTTRRDYLQLVQQLAVEIGRLEYKELTSRSQYSKLACYKRLLDR